MELLIRLVQVNAGVRDIERYVSEEYLIAGLIRHRIGSLVLFLHQETGIDQDAVLAYLPDGRRLTNSNIRELTGSQNQVRTRNHFPIETSTLSLAVHLRFQQILPRSQFG